MMGRKITINVPNELISGLQTYGVSDVAAFLETFLSQVDADELIAIVEEGDTWDEDYDEFDEDEF